MKKKILLIAFCFISVSVLFSQSIIENINSGGASGDDLMFSVGEVFVLPVTGNEEENSGTMGLVFQIILLQIKVGINEIISSDDLRVFPNPVENILKIELKSKLKIEEIIIYDINGKIVKTATIQNNIVNLSTLESGTYFFKTNINQLESIKIIKK